MSGQAVVIFEHGNYEGKSRQLNPGNYNVAELHSYIGNDQLSSIKIPDGWKVTLFGDGDFKGKSAIFEADAPLIGEFNDKTSSLIIERQWPLLKRGSKVDEVDALQRTLVKLGHHIDVDGIFGAKTEAAVIAFQKTNNLTADGDVGKNTWAALAKHMPW
jgi:peptidoglycan hydrolase-like protein with peptidoglycan-binding domain